MSITQTTGYLSQENQISGAMGQIIKGGGLQPRVSDIPDAISKLSNQAERVAGMASDVMRRLEPVLSNCPQESMKQASTARPSRPTQVGDQLESVTSTLHTAEYVLTEILSRLEV